MLPCLRPRCPLLLLEVNTMKCFGIIVLGAVVWMAAPSLWAAAPAGQYTNLQNGTVKDNRSGLVWQQTTTKQDSWSGAQSDCSALNLGEFATGWRLPSKLELESLVDRQVAAPGPTIDLTAFPSAQTGSYWTSTPVAPGHGGGGAWLVSFSDGTSSLLPTDRTFWVRCVH